VIVLYLVAIVAANLSVATFGPSVTVINAFLLIGFDFSCRDYLQSRWEGHDLWLRMVALIAAGGVLSYAVNVNAGPIAVASTVSFVLASGADALVFAAIGKRVGRFIRWNGTNVVGAIIDSIIFPTLAFGSFLPAITAGQIVAKIAGGLFWSVVILSVVSVRRRSA
jgi:uncharacterized PurR-regulated membrane protein YhhQ (DUF165 family)